MKLIIADDHDLVRDALSLLLMHNDPDFEVLHASDYYGAFELLKEHTDTDMVLLDVYMPGMKHMSSVKDLRELYPDLPVVLMSGNISRNDVKLAFEMGANGFIPKTMNGEALASVLKMIKNGVRYVPDIVLGKDTVESPVQFGLSRRENEVLEQLFGGFSNKVIAKNMNIEVSTVKLHLRSLFKKLCVKSRTEAVIVARDNGLHLK